MEDLCTFNEFLLSLEGETDKNPEILKVIEKSAQKPQTNRQHSKLTHKKTGKHRHGTFGKGSELMTLWEFLDDLDYDRTVSHETEKRKDSYPEDRSKSPYCLPVKKEFLYQVMHFLILLYMS